MIRAFVPAAIVVALAAPVAQASDALKSVVSSYLQIQTQLAADKMDGVKASAAEIAKNAAQLEGGKAIAASANELEKAGDLRKARAAFGKLSDAVIAAVKSSSADAEGLKLGFCPMVNASWLQKDGQVRNPYYGSAMLTCGELKDPKK
jgi:HPt (histidine-containing phosphotransfer) domain-containing protein